MRQFRIPHTSARFIFDPETGYVELFLPGRPLPVVLFLMATLALGKLLGVEAEDGIPEEKFDFSGDGSYANSRRLADKATLWGGHNWDLFHEWRRDKGPWSFLQARKLAHVHVSNARTINGHVKGRLADLLLLVEHMRDQYGCTVIQPMALIDEGLPEPAFREHWEQVCKKEKVDEGAEPI
jgi:hypothetical protein